MHLPFPAVFRQKNGAGGTAPPRKAELESGKIGHHPSSTAETTAHTPDSVSVHRNTYPAFLRRLTSTGHARVMNPGHDPVTQSTHMYTYVCNRSTIHRITLLRLLEAIHGQATCCHVWRHVDLPPYLPGGHIFLNMCLYIDLPTWLEEKIAAHVPDLTTNHIVLLVLLSTHLPHFYI
jgi:hypothetical protein